MPSTNGFGQAACAMLCSPALLGATAGATELAQIRQRGWGTAARKYDSKSASKPGLLQPLLTEQCSPQGAGDWPCYTAQRNRDGPLSPVHKLASN